MRLWSIHPLYLDRQGLIALWREGLLAQKVLAGKTRGYRRHPQLIRFQETRDPLAAIGSYLRHVAEEAVSRGYHFDSTKILKPRKAHPRIRVTRGQADYEFQHLLRKLKIRDPLLLKKWGKVKSIRLHPVFRPVPGGVQSWEKIIGSDRTLPRWRESTFPGERN